MNIENFKAGIFSNQFGYPSFVPEFINLEWNLTDPELLTILEECNFRLGELNGLSMVMPDSATFYKMYFAKEGTQSSRIEGTQTEMDETMQN